MSFFGLLGHCGLVQGVHMFAEAYRLLARPYVLRIVESLKTSRGMTVRELAEVLDLSYMGAKQHCMKLEALGLVKTWRVPREGAGRPRKLYQLTEKAQSLFPQSSLEFSLDVLEGARKLFGESAAEKLLVHHFGCVEARWAPKLAKGKSLVEKATRLADLRDQAGCFSRCQYRPEEGFWIEEYHHPLAPVYAAYPGAVKHELRLMERLLGTRVERRVRERPQGGELVVYVIAVLGAS